MPAQSSAVQLLYMLTPSTSRIYKLEYITSLEYYKYLTASFIHGYHFFYWFFDIYSLNDSSSNQISQTSILADNPDLCRGGMGVVP